MSDDPEEDDELDIPDEPDEVDIDEPEPPDPAPFGEQLRAGLEASVGASFVGPDARSLTYTFNGTDSFVAQYLTVAFDGFAKPEQASQEMFSFARGHVFHISGNAVTLSRSPVADPAGQFVSGAILMWRGEGGTPRFGFDADRIWSVQMTYLLLPAFARVIG